MTTTDDSAGTSGSGSPEAGPPTSGTSGRVPPPPPSSSARPPHPDGEPDPVELPDFDTAHRDLDWELPDYRGVRRRRSRPKPKKHWYRPRNTLGIPALVIVLILLVGFLYVNAEMSGIRRAPLAPEFSGTASAGTNVLLVASKSPAHSLAADPDTMVVQLVHLAADGSNASVVDLPSDLYLPDPTHPANKKKGTAQQSLPVVDLYQTGGVPLLAQALQASLGLTIDHEAQIGFAGYVRVTDRLGGVDMPSKQGVRHFTGGQAAKYTSAGSVDSIETGIRNQAWLKAILTATMTPGVLLNPFTLIGMLKDTKPNLVLDSAFTNGQLRGLLWRARHLRPSTIRYLTAPHRGYATRAVEGKDTKGKVTHTRVKVLLPDLAALHQLGGALRTDNDSGVAVFDN